MNSILLSRKLTLINNYIQADYLKSRGKATHDDILVSEVLAAIRDDLESFDALSNTKREEQMPLDGLLSKLETYQEGQTKSDLAGAIETLQTILVKESEFDIDSIIGDLKSIKERQ